jgi:hypothetical protein
MHHQIKRWIDPHLDLPQVIRHWPEIRDGLAEPTRQRLTQIARIFEA